ncbi:GtrA family protein [Aeromicrobium sp. Sec7.5]|uniref:GtrA family protein n=1 Tax=Aeromicrobium sp. Sec7.5 TaxID=3121276 RepID=UPI002FE43D0D
MTKRSHGSGAAHHHREEPDITENGAGPDEVIAGMRGPDGPLLRLVSDRRIAFILVGLVNTGVGYAWFILFLWLGEGRWGYLISVLMTHVLSVLCAFVLYRRLVFRVRGQVLLDLARFESVYLGALAVNLVLLPVFVEVFGMPPLLGQLFVVMVTTLISYTGHSSFSFRRTKAPADDA